MKYKYSVKYINGTTMTFEITENIDLHKLTNTAIAFDDIYINMANVIYIQKQIIPEGGAE